MKRWYLPFILLVFSVCGSNDEGWIARVDDETIKVAEVERLVEERLSDDPDAPRRQLLNEELRRLVRERVILKRASELGVTISNQEVEERMRRLHADDLQRLDPELLEEVRKEMILQRTALIDLADHIRINERTLVQHFEENRERYREPERVQIRQIVVEDRARAQGLRDALLEKADFAVLASQHSLAPEAGGGGRLPSFARGEMPEVFVHAFELDEGETSDVLESIYGFHIFHLESKMAAHEPELEELREQLRFELQQKRLAELEKTWLRELERAADIYFNEPLLESLVQ